MILFGFEYTGNYYQYNRTNAIATPNNTAFLVVMWSGNFESEFISNSNARAHYKCYTWIFNFAPEVLQILWHSIHRVSKWWRNKKGYKTQFRMYSDKQKWVIEWNRQFTENLLLLSAPFVNWSDHIIWPNFKKHGDIGKWWIFDYVLSCVCVCV